MLASGTVFANVVFPKGAGASLQADAVSPQHLAYYLTANLSERKALPCGLPDPMVLPYPLPTNAFAHIKQEERLKSISIPYGGEEGPVHAVSADFVSVQ